VIDALTKGDPPTHALSCLQPIALESEGRCCPWFTPEATFSIINPPYPPLLLRSAAIAVLVRLYEEPEKPGNALDFIKQYLGASVGVDVEGLRAVTISPRTLTPETYCECTSDPTTACSYSDLLCPLIQCDVIISGCRRVSNLYSPLQENDEQKKRIEDLQKQLDEANAKAAEAGA